MISHNLWRVRTNGGDTVIVKGKQEELERLWKENKIEEYDPLKYFTIKKATQC
jgi:hypothetical protein